MKQWNEELNAITQALENVTGAMKPIVNIMADVIRESLDFFYAMSEKRTLTKKERHARAYYRMMEKRGLLK